MKCIVCFESNTGVKVNDYFVSTQNGHLFHYCCAVEYRTSASTCPVCDENLQLQSLVRINGPDPPACGGVPPIPPRPTKTPKLSRHASNVSPVAVLSADGSVRQGNSLPAGAPPLPFATQSQPIITASASYCVEPDYNFKIVILGDFNVGKSSLLQRYADDRFDANISNTVGCDLRVKVIKIAGKTVRLNLWDTAGQERHRAIVDIYLRRADGIIFCYDITDLASFLSLVDWHEFAAHYLPSDITKIIAGTKSDLWPQRVVRDEQIQNLAAFWGAQYVYTSAKDATNVETIFRSLTALILEKRLPSTLPMSQGSGLGPSAPPREELYSTIIKLSPFKNHKKHQNKKDKCCT